MSTAQRSALRSIFPNIKAIIILDNQGDVLGGNNPDAQHFFASTLGLTKKTATLKSQAAFFVRQDSKLNEQVNQLPDELRRFINLF